MKLILLLSLFLSFNAFAKCTPYLLGSSKQTSNQVINTKNTLVWKTYNNRWNISKLQDRVDLNKISCKDKAYLLINNNEISYNTSNYDKDSYHLKRGWNYLQGHKDGVDIVKTFKKAIGVEFVYIYEDITEVWAGYSPQRHLENLMLDTRILSLKKIEPGKGFYVYSKKNIKVVIKNTKVKSLCRTLMMNDKYNYILDSGIDNAMTFNIDKTMGLGSRYKSHHIRGIYNDTRVMLIYPKELSKKNIELKKYGPAKPKIMMEFAKEYEGIKFYVFDYKVDKCYEGTFPSMKVPPFGSLREIK